MSSQHKEEITKKLHEIGADWFRGNDDKYTDANDPVADQAEGRKSYHIHPDANQPILENVVRLDTLDQIEAYIKARKEVLTTPNPNEADKIMMDFWTHLG